MGKIGTCYLMPHPPIIVPEIGQGEEKNAVKTTEAMEEISRDIALEKPEVIIVITPHGPMFGDAMAAGIGREFTGDFGSFGRSEVSLSFSGHTDLTFEIMEEAAGEGIPVIAVDRSIREKYRISPGLDHGALVPLYFINRRYQGFAIVYITYGLLSQNELYRFGKCIQRAVEKRKVRASLVCSGDLSHRLTKGAPAGYNKKGAEFDEKLVSYLKKMEVDKILEMDPLLVEQAGQCGYRSVLVMLGALDGYDTRARILSYEGPYGVGYCTATFKPIAPSVREKREIYISQKESETAPGENSYVRLARSALETYVRQKKVMDPPEWIPEEMRNKRAGVFVSIKRAGRLRGCIGTISPTTENIAREIIGNAISAGARDPRFFPVDNGELNELVYSVDVLGEPEVIQSHDQLDVKRYGVIVRSGRKSGLLLPDIEGVDTPEQQIAIALQKAGIGKNEPYVLERFEVIRHF